MDYRRLIIGFLLLGLLSCSSEKRACYDANSRDVLRSARYEAAEYRGQIIRTIETSEAEPTYSFEYRNEKNQMIVKVESEEYCGYIIVDVETEDDLSSKLQNNKGYSGAVLQGFRYSNNQGVLSYIGLEAIAMLE